MKSCYGAPVLPTKAFNEIKKLKKHIENGCCSEIPVHASTSQNNNLHRHLNHSQLNVPHLAPPLAVALFYVFFRRWNSQICKQGRKSKSIGSLEMKVSIAKLKANNKTESEHLKGNKMFGLKYEDTQKGDNMVVMNEAIKCVQAIESKMNDFSSEGGASKDDDIPLEPHSKEILQKSMRSYSLHEGLKNINVHMRNADLDFASESENRRPVMTASMSAANGSTHTSILEENFAQHKLEQIEVNPDGNCLFNSVLKSLSAQHSTNENVRNHLINLEINTNSNEQNMHVLRQHAVDELLSNIAYYQGHVSRFRHTE